MVCPSCEATVLAPKLGTLKQLEPVDSLSDSGHRSNQTKDSNSRSLRNLLFVSGLALAVLAGAAGLALYQFAQSKVVEFDVEGRLAEFETSIDELPPTVVLQTYVGMNLSLIHI